jgi:pyruvate,water dikinase
MDIEWARDGRTGELFILQARPETVQSRRDPAALEMFKLEARTTPIVSGRSVGAKIGCGPARVIRSLNDMGEFQEGDVLVTEMTDPDWVPILKKASAIVTERGGRTCHAAIVSRELGIPAVIGADHAQEKVPDGQEVTVSCAEGETGYFYPGRLAFKIEKVSLAGRARPNEARRAGRKIGICGQAPSDYPEFAAFLVDCGIDSISLNPDAVLATTTRVADYEAARTVAVVQEPALAAR